MSLKHLPLYFLSVMVVFTTSYAASATGSSPTSVAGMGESYAPTPLVVAPPVPAAPVTASPVVPGLGDLQIVIPPEPTAAAGANAPQRRAEDAGTEVELYSYSHWSGNTYRQRNFSTRVIRDKSEWAAFWAYTAQKPPLDFPAGQMAVVIVLGARPNDGFSVRVSSVRRVGDNFVVTYIENMQSRSRVSQDQVVPWVVQMLPKTQGRVRFMQLGKTQ